MGLAAALFTGVAMGAIGFVLGYWTFAGGWRGKRRREAAAKVAERCTVTLGGPNGFRCEMAEHAGDEHRCGPFVWREPVEEE